MADGRGRWVTVTLVAMALAGAAAWWYWPSDERAIRERLDGLAEAASSKAGDPPMARMARLARFRSAFTEDVHVRVGHAIEWSSRDALLGAVAGWPAGDLSVSLVDEQIAVSPDRQAADVRLTAKVTGRDPSTGSPTLDAREVQFGLVKRDGEWVVSRVEDRDTLERP